MNSTMKNNKKKRVFERFAFVNGHGRSLMIDLHSKDYCLIPSGLALLVQEGQLDSKKNIKEKYQIQDSILEQYSGFLNAKGVIFESLDSHIFPRISRLWDYHGQITNAIFELSDLSTLDDEIIVSLDKLGCNHVEIRAYDEIELLDIKKTLGLFDGSGIMSLDAYLKHSFSIENCLRELFNEFPRLRILTLHSSDEDIMVFESDITYSRAYKTTTEINSNSHCGIVSSNLFNSHLSHFTESQHHNTCLNRKISIDKDGYIKNCPSMAHHYGHISDTKLEDVVKLPEFQKYWHIKKDEITKCKDCEFRHVCTDCRAYLDNPDDLYSAPLKCGYDPYTCTWEDWSTNPLKEKAIEFYGFSL